MTEQAKIHGSIARKILLYILLFSSFITLLVTFYQLYTDYKEQVGMVDQRMKQIELSYRESLGNAIWFLNDKQIESILAGIMKFEDVHYINVQIKDGDSFHVGEKRQGDNLRRFEVDISHESTPQIGAFKFRVAIFNFAFSIKDQDGGRALFDRLR